MPGAADTHSARRLVVNADDFGFSEGINRGILEAFDAGSLRSTSIMVGAPAFDDAVRRAHAAGPRLGVGLHLTLTVGRPLSLCPSLVSRQTGEFVSAPRLLVRALSGRVRAADVAGECLAQLERARDAGFAITHLDGHRHVHVFPVVRDAVLDVARQARIPFVRRPVESPTTPYAAQRLTERLLLAALARQPSIRTPSSTDHFIGLSLVGARHFARGLARLLDTLPPGSTELMVHPGYVTERLPGGDPYTWHRELELRALTSPEITKRLRGGSIVVTNFAELAESQQLAW